MLADTNANTDIDCVCILQLERVLSAMCSDVFGSWICARMH